MDLETLQLWGTRFTPRGVKQLSPLKKLRYLGVSGRAFSDADVPLLASFEHLTTLGVAGTRITPAGFERLQQLLPDCRIRGAPITDPPAR